MSYILDALKKAESERKLGSVPTIHAHGPASLAERRAQPNRRWIWSALLVLPFMGGVLVWLYFRQSALPPPPAVKAQLSAQTMPVVAAQSRAPVMPQSENLQEAAPARTGAALPAAAASKTELPKLASSEPRPENGEQRRADRESGDKARTAVPSLASQPAAAEVPMLHELPENIQRAIPAMVIGGYLYAPDPAARSVVVNNKFLREGDEAAPEIMLEKLLPKEAIFSYRGYRYRLSYTQNGAGR